MTNARALRGFLWRHSWFAALWLGGCAAPAPAPHHAPTILVALHLAGGGAPSPQQVATVHQAFAGAMARAGLEFADSLERADYVLTATLTPDSVTPNGGRIAVNSIEPNRRPRGGSGANREPSSAEVKEMQEKIREIDQWAMSRSGSDR